MAGTVGRSGRGFVIWLTGLPAAGKTTLARVLARRLKEMGWRVETLDGDEVRRWLSPEAGFSREDRERHLKRVAHVSRLLARNGVAVVASFVSPYRRVREEVRKIVEREGLKFVEVYVRCSVETAMSRDPKGLYRRALRGEIQNMTGVQDAYEEPENPEVIVDSERMSPEEEAEEVLAALRRLGISA
ncbi:MAG: adenylyl-sulfate kinase [Candidatus Korarchaeota archaeon]|nr:adenylyl-sulfate kinase [Candidatus Korarchaeota archaeon]